MRKLILFISILFVSTIMYGQTDVVRNYTKPYFVKNVKVNDTLGTKRLIVTYGADTDKILRSDSVGLATWELQQVLSLLIRFILIIVMVVQV